MSTSSTTDSELHVFNINDGILIILKVIMKEDRKTDVENSTEFIKASTQ